MKFQIFAQMCVCLAGRSAENLLLARNTDGSGSDLRQATQLAYQYVAMSDGNNVPNVWPMNRVVYGNAVADKIDGAAMRLLEKASARARRTVDQNKAEVKALAAALMANELLDHDALRRLLGPPAAVAASIIGPCDGVKRN
jgi:ATP-dependent Zn protease